MMNTAAGETIRHPAPAGPPTDNLLGQTGIGGTMHQSPPAIPPQIAVIQIAITSSRSATLPGARKGLLDNDIPAVTTVPGINTIQIVITPIQTDIRTTDILPHLSSSPIPLRRSNPAAGTAGNGGANFPG